MPNRYSHAFVLSNYEARGLTKFNGPRVPQPQPEYATSWSRQSTDNDASKAQHHSLSAGPPPTSSRRLRLRSPSPPPNPSNEASAHPPHQRTDTNFTVVTQTYAPDASLSASADITEGDRQRSRTPDDYSAPVQHISLQPSRNINTRQKQISPSTGSYRMVASADNHMHVELEGRDARGVYSPRPMSNIQRRQSNETAIFSPEASSIPPSTANRQSIIEAPTPGYLRCPPSPPPTPENRQSFSLDTFLGSVPPLPTKSSAEPSSVASPERSIRRSSPNSPSTTLSTKLSTVSQLSSSDASRPKTSSGTTPRCSSRTLAVSARASSLQATTFPPFDSSNSQALSSSIQIPKYSKEPIPSEKSNFSAEQLFFTELESLPKLSAEFGEHDLPFGLPSGSDYEVLPWEDLHYRDTIPSPLRRPCSPSISTRASSFDSAAPPPIGLSSFNGPLPDRSKPPSGLLSDRSRPGLSPEIPKSQPPKLRKSARKPLSSIFHARSHAPISIPYQTTIPGKQPARVSVSRTSAPSIPALFPNYRGPWPPEKIPLPAANPPKAPSATASAVRRTSVNTVPAAVEPNNTLNPFKPNPTPLSAVAPPTSTFRQNGPAPQSPIPLPSRILSNGPAPLAQAPPQQQPRGKSAGPPIVRSRPPGAGPAVPSRKSCFNTDTLDRTFGTKEGRQASRRERRASGFL